MKEEILKVYDYFDLQIPAEENSISEEELTQLLANHLNYLIDTDINGVLTILYRIDVNEQKLKQTLFSNETEKSVGEQLAELIIERQKLKLYYREKYS